MQIRLDCGQINDIQQYNNAMRAAANNKLKRRYIRKKNKNEEEPPWMNREIKNGIKLRRKTNRERRNENDPQKREELWLKYKQIKMETQIKIRNRMREYEEKQTEEIKSNRNKLWENIKKLRGQTTRQKIEIYDTNGEVMEEREKDEEIMGYWSSIYRKHENHMTQEWDNNERENWKSTNSRSQ